MRRHLILLLLLVLSGAARAEAVALRLIETSDRHGHIDEAALLGGYLEAERAAHPGKVLLLDGGDLFTGTLEADLDEGASVIRAMNALGYDATAVGNHDFDFGPVGPHATPRTPNEDPRGALSARMKEAKFPFLTANVVEKDGSLLRGARAFVVREVGGVKVGIVGGTTEDLPRTTIGSNLVGLTVAPLAERIPRAVAEARAAGAQVVVVVVHAGAECAVPSAALDREHPGTLDSCKPGELVALAHAVARRPPAERPDAIFGGHTHRPNALVVDGIPVAQGGQSGQLYAAITLQVDQGRVRSFTVDAPVVLDARHARDEKVAAAVAPDLARAASKRGEDLGVRLQKPLWRAFRSESPFGNLVADELRAATHADVALMNGGGLRADLPAGEVTYGALFEALPFANRLAVMRMTGAQLALLFAANARHDRGILSIAGATVEVRCDGAQPRARVTLASGKPLGDGDAVTVAASDFLALGGDDVGGAKLQVRVDEDGPVLRDVIAAGLKRRHTISSDDPSLFDRAHPRIVLPSPRPVHCPAP